MGKLCQCPLAEAIADLEFSECSESMGQIQKVIFQRVYKSGGVKNSFTTAEIKAKESITPFFAAVDSTKVTITPFVENPVTEPGGKRTTGGGNASLGGVEKIVGREPTAVSFDLNNFPQSLIAQLKSYQCETIGVYLIDENGAIGCLTDNVKAPTKYMPIPIRSFFVGDKKFGGLEDDDKNVMEWHFMPNYSDNLVIIPRSELDYDPLSDLVAPANV